MKQCRRCKYLNRDSAHFCCNCGKEFDTAHIAPKSQTAPKPQPPDFLKW